MVAQIRDLQFQLDMESGALGAQRAESDTSLDQRRWGGCRVAARDEAPIRPVSVRHRTITRRQRRHELLAILLGPVHHRRERDRGRRSPPASQQVREIPKLSRRRNERVSVARYSSTP